MFSQRTSWDRGPTALARLLQERRSAGAAVLDLTESNPSRCELDVPADLVALSLQSASAALYVPDPQGDREAREAVAALYREHGSSVPPEDLLLTASTSEAYSYLFRLLCDAGDEVLIPQPSYPLLDYLADINDVTLRSYRLRHAEEWFVDLKSLVDGLTDRTRALVLVHPNNPTGSYVKTHEREELLNVARGRQIPLIVDEVFWWFPLEREGFRPASFADESSVMTFTLNGISKLLGLPQLKLGWITLSGPAAVKREAMERLEIIADTYLSVNTPIQRAVPELLGRRGELAGPITARIRGNLETLRILLRPSDGVTLIEPGGGWAAMLKLPAMKSSEEWGREFLERAGVLVHPGGLFGAGGERLAVVSLLIPGRLLSQGVEMLLQCVRDAGT